MQEMLQGLRRNLGRVLLGKDREIEDFITAFLANGNVLLNDIPGVGKTTLAKAMASSIAGRFRRLQFTPDLLPADILGGSIYNPRDGTFVFRQGPIFAHVLLADEINRASPRTQSSLLEGMAEGQVSIEGECYRLPQPFWVIATQNPVEFHGTYPLPEAQLDRFCVQLSIGYPPEAEEVRVLAMHDKASPLDSIEAVTSPEEILACHAQVRQTHVDEDVARYVVRIVKRTREDPRVALGVSPRGGIALHRMAQARARMQGRDVVWPDDVKAMAVQTLAHRLILETKAKYSGVTRARIIEDVLAEVKVPV